MLPEGVFADLLAMKLRTSYQQVHPNNSMLGERWKCEIDFTNLEGK
jgi:hypothetical protein